MLDYDRLSCVLELLKSFDHGSKIASKLIQNYFRSNKNINQMQKNCVFKRISNAGLRESHVHDVTITREAPNYRPS